MQTTTVHTLCQGVKTYCRGLSVNAMLFRRNGGEFGPLGDDKCNNPHFWRLRLYLWKLSRFEVAYNRNESSALKICHRAVWRWRVFLHVSRFSAACRKDLGAANWCHFRKSNWETWSKHRRCESVCVNLQEETFKQPNAVKQWSLCVLQVHVSQGCDVKITVWTTLIC